MKIASDVGYGDCIAELQWCQTSFGEFQDLFGEFGGFIWRLNLMEVMQSSPTDYLESELHVIVKS